MLPRIWMSVPGRITGEVGSQGRDSTVSPWRTSPPNGSSVQGLKRETSEAHFGGLPDCIRPKHRWWHIGDQGPVLDDVGRGDRQCLLDLVRSGDSEAGLWFELVDRPAQKFVDNTSQVIGWKNEATFLVDEVAPPQSIIPDVSQGVPQEA